MQITQSIIRRIIERAFNQGDLSILDETVSADSVTHLERWGLPGNRKGFKLFITLLRTAFPDLQCSVENEINEGSWFAAHWSMHGTHKGSFLGSPPTGRLIKAHGIIFGRTENGLIAEDWTLIDQMGILQQLGIVPPSRGI
jgi:steroid delta-isomerase-like uncharacterized protein